MSQLLDRPGRFKAFPVECGLQWTKNGALQWVAKMAISQMLDDNGASIWVDWSQYDHSITAYMTILKVDGEPIEAQINNLRDALGWDGSDFAKLSADFSQTCVQITVGEEEYNGKVSLKVQWVNPENFEGVQLRKLEGDEIKKLNALHGAKLRALAGVHAPTGKPVALAPVQAMANYATPAQPVAAESPAEPVAAAAPKRTPPKPPARSGAPATNKNY